jgi:hypothetical protein
MGVVGAFGEGVVEAVVLGVVEAVVEAVTSIVSNPDDDSSPFMHLPLVLLEVPYIPTLKISK